MDKYMHLLFASLLFFLSYLAFNFITNNEIEIKKLVISLIICLTYSLIPDLDLKKSWIKKKFNLITIYIILTLIICYFINKDALIFIAILIFIEIILFFLKHRGILHALPIGLIISFPLYFIDPIYFVSGFLGFFSHWLGDKF